MTAQKPTKRIPDNCRRLLTDGGKSMWKAHLHLRHQVKDEALLHFAQVCNYLALLEDANKKYDELKASSQESLYHTSPNGAMGEHPILKLVNQCQARIEKEMKLCGLVAGQLSEAEQDPSELFD